MNTIVNESSLEQFPITGTILCNVLEQILHKDDELIITNIETLSNNGDVGLGEIWSEVIMNEFTRVQLVDLVNTLRKADQIITLYMHLANNKEKLLVIDDGEMIINKLS